MMCLLKYKATTVSENLESNQIVFFCVTRLIISLLMFLFQFGFVAVMSTYSRILVITLMRTMFS